MKYLLLCSFLFVNLCIYTQKAKWTLEDCILYAKANNIDVLKQYLQNESFIEEIKKAKGNYYPNLEFNASQGFNLGNSFNVSTGVGQLESSFNSFSLSSSLNVFNGNSNKYNLQKAKLIAERGLVDLDQIYLEMSLRIVNKYLTILFNKEILKVAEEQVLISEQEVKRLKRLFSSALSSKSELLQMESTLASDTKKLLIAKNNLSNSKIELKSLLDINNIENFDVEDVNLSNFENILFTENVQKIYSEAVQKNPLIRYLNLTNEINVRNIKIAKANFYPTLRFNYSYSSNYYHILGREDRVFNQETQQFEYNGFFVQLNNNRTHYLGLNLNVPIFNKFITKTSYNRSEIDLKISKTELENRKNQLKNEIQIAYNDMLTAKASLDAATSASVSQKESFKINQNKYSNGLMTSLDFLKSKTNYIKTESDLIKSKYDYLFKIKILNYYVSN